MDEKPCDCTNPDPVQCAEDALEQTEAGCASGICGCACHDEDDDG